MNEDSRSALEAHANKCSALKAHGRRHTLSTCRHTLTSHHTKQNKDTHHSSWKVPTNAQLATHIQTNAQHQCKQTNADTQLIPLSKLKDAKHAHLLIRADTCTKIPSFGIRAYTCRPSIHAQNSSNNTGTSLEACRINHVKHEGANRNGNWDGTYEWNTV